MKILMVCLGNICRSPLAEGVLRKKAWEANVDWEIDSAGTGAHAHAGTVPHELSIKVAKMHGIEIHHQQARQFVKEDMLQFDKIYVMDSSNYNEVRRISRELWNEEKVDLLMNEVYPDENRAIPDPWYGPEAGYHEVYKMIDKACDNIIRRYADVQLKK